MGLRWLNDRDIEISLPLEHGRRSRDTGSAAPDDNDLMVR